MTRQVELEGEFLIRPKSLISHSVFNTWTDMTHYMMELNLKLKPTKTSVALSCFSHVCLFVMRWTIAPKAPVSMGFHRQEYWSGLPCPPPEDRLHPGIKPTSVRSPALAGGSLPLALPGKPTTSWHAHNFVPDIILWWYYSMPLVDAKITTIN